MAPVEQMDRVIRVSWGYQIHALRLRNEQWADILAGQSTVLQGDGYEHEGESFKDWWNFGGGASGSLVVEYQSEFGEMGCGFDGLLSDAIVADWSEET